MKQQKHLLQEYHSGIQSLEKRIIELENSRQNSSKSPETKDHETRLKIEDDDDENDVVCVEIPYQVDNIESEAHLHSTSGNPSSETDNDCDSLNVIQKSEASWHREASYAIVDDFDDNIVEVDRPYQVETEQPEASTETKKQPITPYIRYSAAIRSRFKKKNPNLNFGQISKLVGVSWRSLPKNEIKLYRPS